MTEKQPKIDRNKVLTTPAREIVFNAVLSGLNLKEAAKQADLSHSYVTNWVTKSEFYPLIRQEQAKTAIKTAKKLEITLEGQIRKFRQIATQAKKAKQYSAATSAEREISTLCGLYAEDNAQRRQVFNLILGKPERKPIESKEIE